MRVYWQRSRTMWINAGQNCLRTPLRRVIMEPQEAKDETCEIVKTLRYFSDVEDKTCGKCMPCIVAPSHIVGILQKLTKGDGNDDDINLLRFLSSGMAGTVRCKGGKEVAEVLANSLSSGEYEDHVAKKRCAAKSCEGLITYRVIAEKCNMCGVCKETCPEGAIFGEKYIPYLPDNAPYTINPEKCTKCGQCVPVCAEGAIELI
jgi:ferredoxin